MKSSQTQGPRAVTGDAAQAAATVVASPGTGHANAASPMRTLPPARPTHHNLVAPPPTDSENKPTGSANAVAEHSFEGKGF